MTLNVLQLTDQAHALLTKSGWTSDRQYDSMITIIEPLAAIGWPIFLEAQRIFTALGMLRLAIKEFPPPPPDPRTTTRKPVALLDHICFASVGIDFDPYAAYYIDVNEFVGTWSSHPLVRDHGGLICPIGSYRPWDTLFVCADGLIVHGSIEFMNPAPGFVALGETIETALNHIAYNAVWFC